MPTLTGLTTNFFATPNEGFTTTTSAPVDSSSATVVPFNSVSGLTNGSIFTGLIDPGNAKERAFTGVVDTGGSQITSVKFTTGTNATHTTGATIVDYVTGTHFGAMAKGILISHDQDGTMIDSLPLTTPKITTSINDSNGNEIIKTPATASAVNEITVTNAATGNNPSISATGGDSAVHLNLRGKGLAKTVTIGAGATTIYPYDYVVSGCVWTGDSYGGSLAASMTAGVVVINGNPITVAAVTARAFTTNVDTYIDVLDNGDGTGLLVYTTAATNAASPALASNSIRIGIIQAAATITAATKVNQGEEDRVFPIASSIAYAVTDSLGNLICPRDSNRKVLGRRQLTSSTTQNATAITDVTGLSVPVIVPTGRKIKLVCSLGLASSGGAGAGTVNIREGSTVLSYFQTNIANTSNAFMARTETEITPTAGLHTYKASTTMPSATCTTFGDTNGATQFIMVELL